MLLADMGSWKQALGGYGWNSDFREGSPMEYPVYRRAEGWQAGALALQFKVQDPTFYPMPTDAHSQMCHNYFLSILF